MLINCVQRKQWNELQEKLFLQKQSFTEGVETSVYLFKNRHNFPVQWQSDLLEIYYTAIYIVFSQRWSLFVYFSYCYLNFTCDQIKAERC